MARPREKPITPTLRRLMALAGCGEDMAEFAKLHGISVHTVRNWDGRGGVPLSRLKEFAARYRTTVEALSAPDELNERDHSPQHGLNEAREPAPSSRYERPPNVTGEQRIDRIQMAQAIDTAKAIERTLGSKLSPDEIADFAAQLYRAAMAGKR